MHLAAEEVFNCTLIWLQKNYFTFQFYVERDIVWTIQQHVLQLVEDRRLSLKVFNDYPIMFNDKRGRVDLALIDENNLVALAVEFKYEPSHQRQDILSTKLPVVFWDEVKKDIERIHHFVVSGKVQAAYSILIDEGGYFRKRVPIDHSSWVDWNCGIDQRYPVALLFSEAMCIDTTTFEDGKDGSTNLIEISSSYGQRK